MSRLATMNDRQYVFGTLLMGANRMETLMERALREFDVTTAQWSLSIALYSLFDQPPTLREVARHMGSSHQNVKQVALKLEKKGILRFVKDPKDARVTRLVLTEESQAFWARTDVKGAGFIESLYRGVTPEELAGTRSLLEKILRNLDGMEEGETT